MHIIKKLGDLGLCALVVPEELRRHGARRFAYGLSEPGVALSVDGGLVAS